MKSGGKTSGSAALHSPDLHVFKSITSTTINQGSTSAFSEVPTTSRTELGQSSSSLLFPVSTRNSLPQFREEPSRRVVDPPGVQPATSELETLLGLSKLGVHSIGEDLDPSRRASFRPVPLSGGRLTPSSGQL